MVTPTEERLRQSLPRDIRGRPAEEVRAGQTLRGGQTRPTAQELRGGGGGRAVRTPVSQLSSRKLSQARDLSRSRADLINKLRQDVNRSKRGLNRNQQLQLEQKFVRDSRSISQGIASQIRNVQSATTLGALESIAQRRVTQPKEERQIRGGRPGFISAPPPTPSPLKSPIKFAERKISEARAKGGVPAFVAGVATTPVGIFRAATQPFKTIEGVIETGKELGKFAIGKRETSPLAGVSQVIREEPVFAAGAFAGDIVGLKVVKLNVAPIKDVLSSKNKS